MTFFSNLWTWLVDNADTVGLIGALVTVLVAAVGVARFLFRRRAAERIVEARNQSTAVGGDLNIGYPPRRDEP